MGKSTRLTPFGRDQRPRIIEALIGDAEVRQVADEERTLSGESAERTLARVRAYAEEIVPQYSARLHHRLAYRLARSIATTLFRVRVGYVDEATLRNIPADASVVFVINHRSNMDYVLVAFLAAERVALSFAVGEWARVWPLDNLLRALGAFFVRRDSRNRLYRKVLERYVQIAVDHGITQGIFPEGGLSRDGHLRAPKLGLLAYATRHFSGTDGRDLVFVPVAINYDRVLEDRTLIRDLDPAAARSSSARVVATALGWLLKNASLHVRGRLFRFGYACVNFGPPLSLRGYLREHHLDFSTLPEADRFKETERLASALMDEIAHIVPITPVSLVASALLSLEGSATEPALRERVNAMVDELAAVGARVYVPRKDAAYFLEVGLRMLTLRRLVVVTEGVYRVNAKDLALVRYYANAIGHFLVNRDESASPAPHIARAARVDKAVILVHGLARTSRSLARLARSLEAAGYTVFNWDYPSRHYGVRPLIDALDRYAKTIAESASRVDFVTHSMGGLLARGVLARGAISHVGRLVMLAPPNQGAEMASLVKEYRLARGFFGEALGDLGRDDAGLADTLGTPSCPFGIVAGTRGFHPLQPTSYYSSLTRAPGTHDGTVGVEETQLTGMADFITVTANHTFIADHEDTGRQVLHFLEHGHFDHARAT